MQKSAVTFFRTQVNPKPKSKGRVMYTKEGKLQDRREMLRIKVKSLAEESRIIRKEEMRTRGELQEELSQHRRGTVRLEARATYLAYGLLRGTKVERIEQPKTERSTALWEKVKVMVGKYGPVDKEKRLVILENCKD